MAAPRTDPVYCHLLIILRHNRDQCLGVAMMLTQRHEKRRSLRRPMRRAAEIMFGADQPRVRCVIWDISDGGARLAVAYPLVDLPRTFTLLLSKDASIQRNCEVVWIDSRYVGVRFNLGFSNPDSAAERRN
jgi:hypothetical protein